MAGVVSIGLGHGEQRLVLDDIVHLPGTRSEQLHDAAT
jgi:hypothetical protein